MNFKTILAGTAIALALTAAVTPANATKYIHLTPTYPGTITGSVAYPDGVMNGDVIKFTFTIKPDYHFVFTDSGSGGTFPFAIGTTATGGAGSYTETYGPFPVKGTLDYTLTTAIPEPASWALMTVGFGLAGASIRRRTRVQATA
jgi:hypothetical protein